MSTQNNSQEKFTLSIWLPAGIVLLVLGILTLLTPFFTHLETQSFVLDMIAGSILALAGLLGILRGRKS